MQKYQDVVLKPNGDVVVGATVMVQTFPGAVNATIYTSSGGSVQAANPITTDSLGAFSFYAPNGRYQLVIAGSGITTKTITDVLLDDPTEVSITEYGPLGVGNDAAVLQAAIDANQGTVNTITIPANTTLTLGSTGITVTAGITIVGYSRDRCFITWTGTTMAAITVATPDSCQFQNLYFVAPSGCTDGGAVALTGSGGVANSFSKVNNCRFTRGWNQVYAPDAYAWEISGNYFSGAVNSGVYVGNTTTPDDGDSIVAWNTFSGLGAAASSVYQVSSGGLRVENNKMNGGLYGYLMDMAAGATTSILVVTGNSIESQTHSGIRMLNTAGTGSMSQVIIDANQFGYQPTPINLDASPGFIINGVISDNVIVCASGATTTSAITVTAVPQCSIDDNVIYGSGTTVVGITIGSSSTNSQEGNNLIYGCVTSVSNATSNTVASATSITLPIGIDVVNISGVTTITSIAAASARKGRVVTLVFGGILTFTDGGNLKLAGNFVTTADDTITLCCADGTNWYEVCRSVN